MRCGDCKNWKRGGGDYIVRHLETPRVWGTCVKLGPDDSRLTNDEETHPQTHETFGCVEFEQRATNE